MFHLYSHLILGTEMGMRVWWEKTWSQVVLWPARLQGSARNPELRAGDLGVSQRGLTGVWRKELAPLPNNFLPMPMVWQNIFWRVLVMKSVLLITGFQVGPNGEDFPGPVRVYHQWVWKMYALPSNRVNATYLDWKYCTNSNFILIHGEITVVFSISHK